MGERPQPAPDMRETQLWTLPHAWLATLFRVLEKDDNQQATQKSSAWRLGATCRGWRAAAEQHITLVRFRFLVSVKEETVLDAMISSAPRREDPRHE